MTTTTNGESLVVRTSRGLSIKGTRITLYAILDYLHANWPPKLIQDWFGLTDRQMDAVVAYLEDHRDEVECEYELVLHQAQSNRDYWETRNRDRLAQHRETPTSPEQEALRDRLRAWQAQIAQK